MKKLAVRTSLFLMVFAIVLTGSGCQQDTPAAEPSRTTTTPSVTVATETTEPSVDPTTSEYLYKLDPVFSITKDASFCTYSESYGPVVLGEFSYFLDTKEALTDGATAGYMLCRQRTSTGVVTPMNILSYALKVYGQSLFLLQSDGIDVPYPFDQVNSLVKLEADGSVTLICQGVNYFDLEWALTQIGNNLYFTRYKDLAIYKADLNGDNIRRIAVPLQNGQDPIAEVRKTSERPLFATIDIYEPEGDSLEFSYRVYDDLNTLRCSVGFNLSTSTEKIEQENTYYWDSRIAIGSYLYYVDLDHPQMLEGQENDLYDIRRMKLDGSGDQSLGIVGFEFNQVGNYLYVNSDLFYGDLAHWSTTRCNLDGTGQKLLDYGDMKRYTEGDRLYFTQGWGNEIWVADTACNEQMSLEITVPDDNNLQAEIGDNHLLTFISVYDVDGDWVYFWYTVTDYGPYTFYEGQYRVNLKTKVVEKINEGEFFSGW